MKKHCYAGLLLLAIALFPALQMNAQEENKEYLWYCWEETVKPEMYDQYLSLIKELHEVCKNENFPFQFFTWSRTSMVYELWYPIKNLNDVNSIDEAWGIILEKWGNEKYEAYSNTLLSHQTKTCTLLDELTYMPENPELSVNERTYGRWIEIYLKPGTQKEFAEAVKQLNEQRAAFGIEDYIMFASCGFGYPGPSYLGLYSHESREAFNASFESSPEAYLEKFDAYLNKIEKLMREPVKIYHYTWIQELSYFSEE